MDQTFWTGILISIIFGVIVTIISIRKALKNPEQYQKMSDEAYAKINDMKKTMTNNTISWEDAKKQAAAELALEEQIKSEKKAAKLAKKNKNK